jgi:hypothetical protein
VIIRFCTESFTIEIHINIVGGFSYADLACEGIESTFGFNLGRSCGLETVLDC